MRFPSLYKLLIKPILFLMDAERAHHLTLRVAAFFLRLPLGPAVSRALYSRGAEHRPISLAGLQLKNPLGLAAGFDKNGTLIPGLETLGFGFLEIGTITPRPQQGNPRPRLFRVPEKNAIVNRMGFNNDGARAIALRLRKSRPGLTVPLGINIGKNRDTPNANAVNDYEILFKDFRELASYFVVNISSPNTPGLRDLQSGEFLQALGKKAGELALTQPVFVKLAPDVATEDLESTGKLCGQGAPFAGLILTNTIPTDLGGMSGRPLKEVSAATLKRARQAVAPEIPIISVGGIETADDVLERFRLGANAVQIYSALIYEGPGLAGRVLSDLRTKMRTEGIRDLTQLRDL